MLNRNYHFAVRDNGSQVEELGDMELRGDGAALTFGKLIIRELIHKDSWHYIGCTMNITQDERTVGRVPFK